MHVWYCLMLFAVDPACRIGFALHPCLAWMKVHANARATAQPGWKNDYDNPTSSSSKNQDDNFKDLQGGRYQKGQGKFTASMTMMAHNKDMGQQKWQ